jgi:hypothetical protein
LEEWGTRMSSKKKVEAPLRPALIIELFYNTESEIRVFDEAEEALAALQAGEIQVPSDRLGFIRIDERKLTKWQVQSCFKPLPLSQSEVESLYEANEWDGWFEYAFDTDWTELNLKPTNAVLDTGESYSLPIFAYELDGDLVPVYFKAQDSYDDNDGILEQMRTPASYSWSSDGGGAPISWYGGSTLTLVHPNLYLVSTFGDSYDEPIFLKGTSDTEGIVKAIWDWESKDDCEAGIALALLQPLESAFPGEDLKPVVELWNDVSEMLEAALNLTVDEKSQLAAKFLERHGDFYLLSEFCSNPNFEYRSSLLEMFRSASESGIVQFGGSNGLKYDIQNWEDLMESPKGESE